MKKNKEEKNIAPKLIEVKMTNSTIGFLQALGVVVYCSFISGFFWIMEKTAFRPPRIIVSTLMLIIFVFSAAITGLLVFGYPFYLAVNKKEFKKPLAILGHTFFFLIIIISLILFFILL